MRFLRRNTPDLPLDEVADVLVKEYGLVGDLTPFESERDQNVRVDSNERSYLFKVCNADEDESVIDLQIQALRHIERVDPAVPVPRALPTLTGADTGSVVRPDRTNHTVRLMSFLDGVVAGSRPEFDTPAFRRNTGETLARLDSALRGFFHPAARQDHPWDMSRALRLLEYTRHIQNESARSNVVAILERVRDHTLPACVRLRHQVIHQDAHTWNLVVDPGNPADISGIIDFGDMVHGPLISELAVAAYLGGRADPSPETRAHGGLVVSDEVQSGFGRTGVMWGYQRERFAPDMVTIGKPVANGQPLGVVVTKREILDSFMEQAELFSTFGGNPVSCAAGLAVLDVIENDGLVANSATVGQYLKDSLTQLAETQSLIGDVRGSGLLVGLELVSDRDKKTPAVHETALLVELMREAGVLVGIEGSPRSSLKLRPPLIVRPQHVDIFIEALDSSLDEVERQRA